MKIGDLAQRTGITPSRIRFYERIGLLKSVRRQGNGYRSFPTGAIQAVKLIVAGQRVGFSLAELRTLVPDEVEYFDRASLRDTLLGRVKDIEEFQNQLAVSRSALLELLGEIESNSLASRALPGACQPT